MTERKVRKLLKNAIPFETERLIIRAINTDDAYDMYEYASLDEVCEFLLWSPHINLQATEGYIEYLEKRYIRGLYGDFAVVLKENGKMIGTCGYADINSHDGVFELGYVLSPYYRGKGYMTEAVDAFLDLSFNILGLKTAKLRIIKENISSVRLAKRFGFTPDPNGEYPLEIKGTSRAVIDYLLKREVYIGE